MFWITLEKLLIKLYDHLKDKLSSPTPPSSSDLYLGEARKLYYRDKNEKLFLSPEIRRKHFFLLGGTGTGKTTLITHFLRQDVSHDQGFMLLEPHSDLCESLICFLASVWAGKDRQGKIELSRKTIIVEPFNPNAVVCLNPLETPDNASVYPCVLELTQVFKDKWQDMWGPRMAELLRGTLVSLAEHHLTLLEAPSFLTDIRFRNSLLENLQNQEVKEYFIHRYNRLREWDKVKYREPVMNKLTEFLTDQNIRYAIGAARNSLNCRRVMDNGQYLILNMSKGRLKINSLLMGGLFLAKIQLACLSRSDVFFVKRRFFTVYLDEFQNFLSQDEAGDVETLLSESRKYGLSLVLANQTLSQLNQKLIGTILGNVAALICFRLSHKDASVLASEIEPQDKGRLIEELMNLKVGQAYLKVKGEPARLVSLPLPPTPQVDSRTIKNFRDYSALFHSRSAQEIEREIQERWQRLGINLERNNPTAGANGGRENANPGPDNGEGQNEW